MWKAGFLRPAVKNDPFIRECLYYYGLLVLECLVVGRFRSECDLEMISNPLTISFFYYHPLRVPAT